MEEQNISIFSSLAAKIFYGMVCLVVFTVAGISFQNFNVFTKYVADHAASAMVTQAESVIAHVESQIDTWNAQVATVAPDFFVPENPNPLVLDRLIDSNNDFLAVRIYSAPSKVSTALTLVAEAKSKRESDARLEDKSPESVIASSLKDAKKELRKRVKSLSKSSKKTLVHTLAKPTGLPLVLIATRFDKPDSKEVLWSVLICWQSQFIKALPKSTYLDSALVNTQGRVFSSNMMNLMVKQSRFAAEPLTKEALSAKKVSNFVAEYQSLTGRRVIGGYARLPEYGLIALVEEDTELVYEEMKKNQFQTMMWSFLFILIGGMISYILGSGINKNLQEIIDSTKKFASGNLDHVIFMNSKDEISEVANSINLMTREIVTLMNDNIEKADLEREMATSKTVQNTFFPKNNILTKNLRATGFYQAAKHCGGDLWGHFEISEDVHFLYIADAMGIGTSAALVTAMAYSVGATLSNLAKNNAIQITKPSEILSIVNTVICQSSGGKTSMTFFCALIDTRSGKMTYSNAGHNFPFLIPLAAEDNRRPLSRKTEQTNLPPISIKLMGNPLGMDPRATFEDKEMDIRAGDKFFLFTDGLIECSSPKGEVWGRKHLLDQLTEGANLSCDELKDEILSKAFTFFSGKPLEDDVTVVVAEIPKSWKPLTVVERAPRKMAAPPPLPSANSLPPSSDEAVAIENNVSETFLFLNSTNNEPDAQKVSIDLEISLTSEKQNENPAPANIAQAQSQSPDVKKEAKPKGRYKIKLPTAG